MKTTPRWALPGCPVREIHVKPGRSGVVERVNPAVFDEVYVLWSTGHGSWVSVENLQSLRD